MAEADDVLLWKELHREPCVTPTLNWRSSNIRVCAREFSRDINAGTEAQSNSLTAAT